MVQFNEPIPERDDYDPPTRRWRKLIYKMLLIACDRHTWGYLGGYLKRIKSLSI